MVTAPGGIASWGAMQDWPLRVTTIIDHAAREHGTREIVTRWADGTLTRTTWGEVRHDALRMAEALRAAGIQPGERVATLGMNHARHLVAWYGATGMGGVLHTLNVRLFDDQLAYIVNHAEDAVLLYDAAFAPLVERMAPRWPTIRLYVCFDAPAGRPAPGPEGAVAFADWIAAQPGTGSWTQGDEKEPMLLCYTSGTTGHPKGVLYSHRSTVLHALSGLQPSIFDFDPRSVMLPVVPMFHACAWGLPWGAAMAGAKLVYSAVNEAKVLCDLMRDEKVTHLAGVPTVWLAMLDHVDAGAEWPATLRRSLIGGSAAPRRVIEELMRRGVEVGHAWGMTETSPIGTTGARPANWDAMDFAEQVTFKMRQGRAPYGVELRCVDLDDPTHVLPRDGVTAGALQVRGPWVVERYFRADAPAVGEGDWFDTGDVAVIHPDGTMQITDRTKDVIKSGGEWISSVELENAAVGCPGVAEAAAIGIPHPRWDERPLLAVVRRPGSDVTADQIRAYLADKVARWWLPDAIEFVAEIPHTGSGKISKKDLRDMFAGYALPDVERARA